MLTIILPVKHTAVIEAAYTTMNIKNLTPRFENAYPIEFDVKAPFEAPTASEIIV
jgi:hypothetical protein